MEQQFLPHEESGRSTELSSAFPHQQFLTGEETVGTQQLSEQAPTLEDLGAALSEEAHQFRRTALRAVIGFSIFFPFLIWVLQRWTDTTLLTAPAFVPGLMAGLCLLVVVLSVPNRKQRRRRRQMTVQVADQRDVSTVGSLVDAMHLDDGKTREVARKALTGLLPRLRASDAALLNEAQRARLCHILSLPVENPLYKDLRHLFRPAQSKDVEFRIAILQAFEQVGDSRALSIVERLAKEEARTRGEKRIQAEAAACLPTLQFRVELERSSQTLLRASHSFAADDDTLLRPVVETGDRAPEQLLRSSEIRR